LRPIDPLILSQTRTTFSLLVLLPVLLVLRGWQRLKLPGRDLAQCLVLGVLGVAVSNYFYYVAIQKTNVATAIILQYTAPVWLLLYVVARGRQKLSLQKVAAVGLAVTGIALVIGVVGGNANNFLRLNPAGLLAETRFNCMRSTVPPNFMEWVPCVQKTSSYAWNEFQAY